jgi:hypothetical protein
LKIALAVLCPLQFHVNLRTSFFISVNKDTGILVEIVLNL